MQPAKALFVIYKDKTGEWRWRLLAPNTRIIADSAEGYSTKEGAIEGIKDVKRYAPDAEVISKD